MPSNPTRLTPAREAEIRARLAEATPGPWAWYGNTRARSIYLATRRWGRFFVMQFDRWGMQGAAPTFRNWGGATHGERPAAGFMQPFHEMAPSVEIDHNGDIMDITHPDATFIAHAPADVAALLAEVEALRADAERLAVEPEGLRTRVEALEVEIAYARGVLHSCIVARGSLTEDAQAMVAFFRTRMDAARATEAPTTGSGGEHGAA